VLKVNVSDLRNRLPEYLEKAQAGEEIPVTRRGRVIARLTAAQEARAGAKERLLSANVAGTHRESIGFRITRRTSHWPKSAEYLPREKLHRIVEDLVQKRLARAIHLGFIGMTGRMLDSFEMIPRPLLEHLGDTLGIAVPTLASLRALYSRRSTLFEHQRFQRDCTPTPCFAPTIHAESIDEGQDLRSTRNLSFAFGLLILLALSRPAFTDPVKTPDPGPEDTCPVCGMFVAKYPEWIATVLYKDGHAHHFDGAKDLFKYLLDMPKWAPGHGGEDIAQIGVTEYYGLSRIAAKQAWYVIGSDVLGPMGHELVPLQTRADAEEFMRDHAGQRILQFDEVTLDLLTGLDDGRFR
jgi:prevent-host-death family protein